MSMDSKRSEETNKVEDPGRMRSEPGKDEHHFPEDRRAPQPQTIGNKQETADMEVHKHPHHVLHKKKWPEYLLEFLMLFLAVFLGFLAENQREHMVEHQREKEYMVTMLEDLKSDTIRLNEAIVYWAGINVSIDSLAAAITFPSSTTDFNKAYRYLNKALDYYSFTFNDRTVAQLKNAGGFRLIRKKNVANKIIAYDQFNTDAIKNIASQYNRFYENVVLLRNKAFSQDILYKIFLKYRYIPTLPAEKSWIDSLIHENKSPFSVEIQTALLFEFKNALLAFRKDYSNVQWGSNQLLEYQKELMKLITDEYDVK